MKILHDLNERSQEIFRHVVEAYVETGEPIGSQTLSRKLGMSLSSATIRSVMADLEDAGLLYSPHTSSGRLPTEAGLRLFVHGLLEVGQLSPAEKEEISRKCQAQGQSFPQILEEATSVLSGLSRCAGLIMAPKCETNLKHMEFVALSPGRGLVVLVTQEGVVENRVIDLPLGMPPSSLTHASNFLNSLLAGNTLSQAKEKIIQELNRQKGEIDHLTSQLIETGLAVWSGDKISSSLIVKGQSHLLQDVTGLEDLSRLKNLFDALEAKKDIVHLLDATIDADGIQIFIGSNNGLFNHTGCSLIVSPYLNGEGTMVGAIGVIGPTRLNYGRIIPMVDYTAKVIGKLLYNLK
jgi:heat-inducible transcriptional repressor